MAQLAYRYVQDVNRAKDIAQEVFLKLWEKRNTLQINTNIKSYLLTATRNTALNEIRKAKGLFKELSSIENRESNALDPGEVLESKEMEALIYQTIESLPARCRSIFLLRKVDGLPVKEIARQLNISNKTVENQITKALKRLGESLEKYVLECLLLIWFLC
jgi:RNA polymerase sigma-70 factor (ECF subfamily)